MNTVWGAHAPSRAGDGALAIANFNRTGIKACFGEGAETSTRVRVRSLDFSLLRRIA